VLDGHYLKVCKDIQILVKGNALEHLEDVLVLVVVIDVDLPAIHLP